MTRPERVLSQIEALTPQATATNSPPPYVTDAQALSAGLVRDVHVIPSGDVITRLPVPEEATATKMPFAYVTIFQLLLAALVRDVHVIPSGDVITRLPVPVVDSATKIPLPYVIDRKSVV